MLELWLLYSELAGVEFANWEVEPPPPTTPKENVIPTTRQTPTASFQMPP